ncbi:MAG: hypothetical protein ACLQU4_15025 [Limisphaerales bacterium]
MKNASRFSVPSHFGMMLSDKPPIAAAATNHGQAKLVRPVNVLLAGEKRASVETLGDLEQFCWQWF